MPKVIVHFKEEDNPITFNAPSYTIDIDFIENKLNIDGNYDYFNTDFDKIDRVIVKEE